MTGADTVASAIVAGKKAAEEIHFDLVISQHEVVNYYYLDDVIEIAL